ncbi:FtsP/CotA-like multicopper oxidase with cupredoxin domain [Nonomuraea muscovyensis]|uniref:FtsP/CotA-like multicopper oxidase with cupredoxin domain n=1 Tax=Nonomuraea muscovyensis TaxID=1124761 RepID=A0A7X0BZJ3_9ACTN|nr:multicopper oxidase domain-containing protein [Nonomuraea muscovyensis]MBB6345637.1 FtsP/CotA-like multicopper oxidase with cupredoxin domain [Nonomuraea muscovyensis]
MKRRNFLALAATAGLVAAACDPGPGSRWGLGGRPGPGFEEDTGPGAEPGAGDTGSGTTVGVRGDAEELAGLQNPLMVPPLIDPEPGPDGVRRFELTAQAGRSRLLPGRTTPTWGFNGDVLGPTIRVRRGDVVQVAVTNALDETTDVHWHGMRLPAAVAGGPHRPIASGETWTERWIVDQPATTAWYHPYPLGRTAGHAGRGLAGMLVVDDYTRRRGLPSAYGVDDIPLILQDARLAPDGSLAGEARLGAGGAGGGEGGFVLVNGTAGPFLDVISERVRFRVVNGSGTRVFDLAFGDGRPFHVVGNDAGLLAASVEVSRVSVAPGERVELVAAFLHGETVLLRDLGGPPDPGQGGAALLKIVVAPRLTASRPVPRRPAVGLLPIEVPPGARVRRFRPDGRGSGNTDLTRIDLVVPAAATEVWEIDNPGDAGTFHLQGATFQVLDVAGDPAPPHAQGYKDTVYLPARAAVRLAVRFGGLADPGAPYLYHFRTLGSAGAGTTGQFVIVQPGEEARTPRTLPPRDTPDDLQ